MELITHTSLDSCIIALKGDLDLHVSSLLDAALKKFLDEGPGLKKLYVDCKDLQYISSAGLSVFAGYLSELKAQHIALIFYGMNHLIKDIFSIAQLNTYVTILASEEEAGLYSCHPAY